MVSAFASFKFGVAFAFTQLIAVLMVFYVSRRKYGATLAMGSILPMAILLDGDRALGSSMSRAASWPWAAYSMAIGH